MSEGLVLIGIIAGIIFLIKKNKKPAKHEEEKRISVNRIPNDKVAEAYKLIGNVEGKRLDRQQMECIVKDAHSHLVIAGAGTGKTTTIIGKLKYLLKTEKYESQDILVLSFTNASASEMRQRINKELECDIEASTFHKLGLNIITNVNGIAPTITHLNMRKFIKNQLELNMKSETYLNVLVSYLIYDSVVSRSEFEFETENEYKEYLRLNPPVTFNKEIVKSYGEMDIANFLAQNGIRYIYEHPYKIDTRTEEYSQYYPDFYLPDYDIYIEYFGVNKDGEVPIYFKGKNGLSATKIYQDSMKWKRNIHKKNKTILIECYAYEKYDGTLLKNLKNNLLGYSVKLNPKNVSELLKELTENKKSALDGIINLFETVINLIKSNGYTIETVKQLNTHNSNVRSNKMLLFLIEPIYNAYCSYLKEHNEIDFNDMINIAAQYIEQNQYIHSYKCVIVDEYQDISKARYRLLKKLRKSKDFELFCVGDDWQSIYRFAGSDISYILNFEAYWGMSEVSKIETTYRFSQQLVEVSNNFIMQNPMQIKKHIMGNITGREFAVEEICGAKEDYLIDFLNEKMDVLPENCTVFLIGRYSSDIELLEKNPLYTCQYNNISGFIDVKYYNRIDLKITYITVHKSKGLQADYVFIINNRNSRMGFPSKIQDAAILRLLLEDCDHYPYAEERRLFYVALTRAKRKVFLLTSENKVSGFVKELREKYSEMMKSEQYRCPQCGGRLFKRAGPYGEFYGCSNYQSKGCTYKRKIQKVMEKA